MLANPISIAIVDDQTLFRKTLKSYLSDQKDFNVVFQVGHIFDLFRQLKEVSIDILLMDIFMPDINGHEAVASIRKDFPEVKILVLSMSTDLGLVSEMLDAGIHGYICKADDPDELLHAIYAIANNRIYRNRIFTEALYYSRQNSIKRDLQNPSVELTEREKKMLQLIWEEKNNKEIADALFLGVRSVEKIRQDMKEKLSVRSTIGLLKYAISKKIIKSDFKSPSLIR
jgi:DNA-binding NarL/FixJ family response regulator